MSISNFVRVQTRVFLPEGRPTPPNWVFVPTFLNMAHVVSVLEHPYAARYSLVACSDGTALEVDQQLDELFKCILHQKRNMSAFDTGFAAGTSERFNQHKELAE